MQPRRVGIIALFLFGAGFFIFGTVTTAKRGPGPQVYAYCTFSTFTWSDDAGHSKDLTTCYDKTVGATCVIIGALLLMFFFISLTGCAWQEHDPGQRRCLDWCQVE
ncbi:unnamed protein product [Meganyctiphanes norvegica]|uniref:Uncharacterized protein n=1 Tax=Meganyctiphanes norvegica TaxID=48144 RepID=A0AAV2RQD1_MEGNR